jgi:serine protease Do
MRYFILIFCLWITSSSIVDANKNATEIYPLPASELERVLSDWLTESGYIINRSSLEMGRIEISAFKADKNWKFIINPRSALAAEVWMEPSENTDSYRELLKRMSQYISNYIETPDAKTAPPNHNIPPAVLSQLESVVCIRAQAGDRDIQISGFIFDKQGFILCTTHDLQDLFEIEVTLYNGHEIKGRIIKADLDRDLALVRIDKPVQSFIPMNAGRRQINLGEKVYSVGCPVNLIGTIHPGIINAPPRRSGQALFWQVNMDIYPGSSGSPVFDQQGKLVGMVKGRFRGTRSIGFLIPLESIVSFLKEGSPAS